MKADSNALRIVECGLLVLVLLLVVVFAFAHIHRSIMFRAEMVKFEARSQGADTQVRYGCFCHPCGTGFVVGGESGDSADSPDPLA